MDTFVIVLLLLVGLALVTVGADWMVDGASGIAKRFGVSEFVIGLTIVALGTSAPEMVVSFIAAIQGNSDISVGNIIGSNIFNTAIILGLSALLAPIVVTANNRKYDIPVNLAVTAMLIIFGLTEGHILTRLDGALFLVGFVAYLIFSFKRDKPAGRAPEGENADGEKPRALPIAILMVAAGLGALVYGGQLFVDNAQKLARLIGLSDKVIAVTVIAAGTSLPELATSVVAAVKGKSQLALGNIIGSNTFNILLILGGSAMIRPLSTQNIGMLDYAALGLTSFLLLFYTLVVDKNRLNKAEGAFLLLLGIAYMAVLCII